MPFFEGQAVHEALQGYYDNGDPPVAVFDKWAFDATAKLGTDLPAKAAKDMTEGLARCRTMLAHYVLWQAQDTSDTGDANLSWIATELEFSVPLATDFTYAGRLDGVVQKKSDNTYWLFETKTCRGIEERKAMLANDEQSLCYIWAAQQALNVRISGVIYNLLRKKAPAVARQLANGQLSQDKTLDTTVEFYKAQLDELAALSPDNPAMGKELYDVSKPFLQFLYDKGNMFFERYEVRRTRSAVEQAAVNLVETALDMASARIYPNGGRPECLRCMFREPCLVLTHGGDPSALLEQEYKPRQAWKETIDERSS